MANSLSWYIERLKTLSLPETVFRARQFIQFRLEKRKAGIKLVPDSYSSVPLHLLHLEDLENVNLSPDIHLFGIKKLPSDIKDWSYDFLTGKRFPQVYAKDINMRTDQYGSAKHVWEYNRLLFLPQLALAYKKTNDASYLDQILQLTKDWINQNPYLIGINWHSSIEISVRLINWMLTWEILDIDSLIKTDPKIKKFVDEVWMPSIYQHCKYSASHPSYYSSANNHLITEYAGLFIASSKWKFKESEKWNAFAKAGLEKEIILQNSENGINKEEAAEYIQFITDFFLLSMLVADKTNNSFSQVYKDRLKKIFTYINNVLDIKGHIPKYGDEDDGRLFLFDSFNTNTFSSFIVTGLVYFKDPSFAERDLQYDRRNLLLFGQQGLKIFTDINNKAETKKLQSSVAYPKEGHFIFKKQQPDKKEIYCHFDAAPLGYLSIAAHGHSDALSFILHVDGDPVFVDPGTYCYHTHADWRKYYVSSLAHNTITIDGESQAKFVGPTLWLDHYNVKVDDYKISDSYDFAQAEHDGYKNKNTIHKRKVEFFKDKDQFLITDNIIHNSSDEILVELPFHIHPDIDHTLTKNNLELNSTKRNISLKLDDKLNYTFHMGESSPIFGWYSESFYEKKPAKVLLGSIRTKDSITIQSTIQINANN